MTITSPRTFEVVERYRRRDSGRALREAMTDAYLTIQRLGALSGVNWRTIGFLVASGSSGRETCSTAAAEAVAGVLGVPVTDLFEPVTRTITLIPVSAERGDEADDA